MSAECTLCPGEVAGGSWSCLGVGRVVIVLSMCSSYEATVNHASSMTLSKHGL